MASVSFINHFKIGKFVVKANTKHRNIVATTSRPQTHDLNNPHKSPPGLDIVVGLLLAAGASTAIRHVNTPKYIPNPPNSHAAASRIITIQKPVEYSSLATFPSCDIGSLGGLVPTNWGLPYNGKNPSVALVMASAGVTMRMIINVTIIYMIKKYWIDL